MEATTTAISDQSNKENVPPVYNAANNKGKIPILPHAGPSLKNNHKKKGSKRKPKKVPLADITALFNNNLNSAATTTFTYTTTLPHQPQYPSDPSSISRRRTVLISPASKTLRMGFR